MGEVETLQESFVMGMRRDVPRSQLPRQALWNAVDVLPNLDAPGRERGGWVHHSNDISATTATASYVIGGAYPLFITTAGASDAENIAIDEDGRLYKIAAAGTVTDLGAGVTVIQNPVFHGGVDADGGTSDFTGLLIVPDGTGAAVPKKYDGTTLGNLDTSAPKARYATVHKDYTVLANGTVGSTYYPTRVWFSPEGDPDCAVATAWDTTDSWIDFSQTIIGLSANRTAMLVFHDQTVSRVRGAIPPPDSDMVVDHDLFRVGLFDAFSIAEHRDQILWASPEGVFRSDAVVLDDLTRRGGMLRYWLDLVKDATSTWRFSGGTLRDTYFLCVMDGTTFKDCFAIDLYTASWTRLSNVDATAFWSGFNGDADELYWGRRGAARVSRMSSISRVADSTYKNDGDGDAVASVVETPFFPLGKAGLKRLGQAYFGYELTDYASDNPTCAVSYVLTTDETSYTSLGTLSELTAYERKRLPVNMSGHGIAFKFARANAGDFLLHDIGLEHWPYDRSGVR